MTRRRTRRSCTTYTFADLTFQHQAYTLPEAGVGFHQAEEPLGAAIEGDGLREVIAEQCADLPTP